MSTAKTLGIAVAAAVGLAAPFLLPHMVSQLCFLALMVIFALTWDAQGGQTPGARWTRRRRCCENMVRLTASTRHMCRGYSLDSTFSVEDYMIRTWES